MVEINLTLMQIVVRMLEALWGHGDLTVEELVSVLDLGYNDIAPCLAHLVGRGVVERDGDRYGIADLAEVIRAKREYMKTYLAAVKLRQMKLCTIIQLA